MSSIFSSDALLAFLILAAVYVVIFGAIAYNRRSRRSDINYRRFVNQRGCRAGGDVVGGDVIIVDLPDYPPSDPTLTAAEAKRRQLAAQGRCEKGRYVKGFGPARERGPNGRFQKAAPVVQADSGYEPPVRTPFDRATGSDVIDAINADQSVW